MSVIAWTEPYYGVSHLGRLSDERSATITARVHSDSCDVVCWSRHVGMFQSPEFFFETVAEGRAAAEAWVSHGTMPVRSRS